MHSTGNILGMVNKINNILSFIIIVQSAVVLTQLFMFAQERKVVAEAGYVADTLKLAGEIDSGLIEKQRQLIDPLIIDRDLWSEKLAGLKVEVEKLKSELADLKHVRENLNEENDSLEKTIKELSGREEVTSGANKY